MEPDLKNVKNAGTGESNKDEIKNTNASRRSGRKVKTIIEEDPNINKKMELPPTLMPKFPSQKIIKQQKSPDKNEPPPARPVEQTEENEENNADEKEKHEIFWQEGVIEECQGREDEGEVPKEQEEHAHVSPDPTSLNDKKSKFEKPNLEPGKPEKPEKLDKPLAKPLPPPSAAPPPVAPLSAPVPSTGAPPSAVPPADKKMSKQSTRDKKSGRSTDRNIHKKKDVAALDENKKSPEDKKKDAGTKKGSTEDASTDNLNNGKVQSRRKSKRQKKSIFQQPVQRTPGSHPSAYLQPTRARTERSLKLPPAEPKSVDERPRKPSTQILQPQQPNRGGQVQKQPSKVVLQPGAPGATPVASTPNQREQAQQQQQQQQKGPMGLFKKIYRKMNFRAASDCTVEPTKEMLAKSYVRPEHNSNDPIDFCPDLPKKLFDEEAWKLRMTNKGANRNEVFLNNRPFWLTRDGTEQIPKVRIQLHRPLKQMHSGNPASIQLKLQRTDPFLDPKEDTLERLKIVDKAIGVDPLDLTKDRELKRVCANTFHGTLMFEVDKRQYDTQQKKAEAEALKLDPKRKNDGKEKDQKSSFEDPKKVAFNVSDKCTLHVYFRKHRPLTNQGKSERFTEKKYTMGERKIMKKGEKPAVPQLVPPTSSSTTSASSSSCRETKKL